MNPASSRGAEAGGKSLLCENLTGRNPLQNPVLSRWTQRAALGFLLVSWAFPAAAQSTQLKASDFLPAAALKGSNYTVRDAVKNDGLVNTYSLDTSYGELVVEGTPQLYVRLRELKALEQIAKIEESDAYTEAAKQGAKSPLKGAEALIEDPVGAVKGAATGIGRWMSDIGRSIASNDPNQAGVAETALGQAAAKRAYAYRFGVDPYTKFEPLDKALNDVAWATAGGGLTMKVAFALIPGAVGTVVSATGTTDSMRALVRDKSPVELEKINRGKLEKIGVSGRVAEAFLVNVHFSPQDKTVFTGELARLDGLANRKVIVDAASRVTDRAHALFMLGRVQMMAKHAQKEKLAGSLIAVDGTLFLKSSKGALLGHFPLDYIAPTAALQSKLVKLETALAGQKGLRQRQLYIGGVVPAETRRLLEEKGWKVADHQYSRLLSSVDTQ